MIAKLIKTEVNYLLKNEEGVIIASTSLKKLGLALSIKNCQAVELGYDLDELASERLLTRVDENSGYHKFGALAYKEGFQKALEILGDKKFSEKDVISMIEKSRETGLTAEYLILNNQQTEWDVEIEMQRVKDETKIIGSVKGVKGSGSKITTYKSIPKLDADGCLILKRK